MNVGKFPKIWNKYPKFSEKIKNMIIYFTFSMNHLSLYRLIKLMYISEFYSIEQQKKRMTNSKFYKYYYGPWSPDIEYTGTVIAGNEILMKEDKTKEGYEATFFVPNVEKATLSGLSHSEISILKNVINDWKYVPTAVLVKLCKSTTLFSNTEFGDELKIEEILNKGTPHILGYEIILEKEKKGYYVECPTLPGCVSQGETEEEAKEGIRNAIMAYIECIVKVEEQKHG